MCNIAGYVGSERAAPILLKMMKEQEGFLGGFYSGLATLHEGKIYYAKLTGDVDRLIANTNAMELPGSIGIIHSRSKSGGGDEWSHPFVGIKNGEVVTAYVANGSIGCFQPRKAELNDVAMRLFEEGYSFPSAVKSDDGKYQRLPDGRAIHMSDTMCQLILAHMDQGKEISNAMTDAFCEMPSEIVGLLLSVSDPNAIYWSRVNMPMFVGFAEHGAYLSSTPTAIPSDAKEYSLLPACSSGVVRAGEYTEAPYQTPPARVAPMRADLCELVEHRVRELLTEREMNASELVKTLRPMLLERGEWDCAPTAAMLYETLNTLMRQGLLQSKICRVDGAFEDLDAPKIYMRL